MAAAEWRLMAGLLRFLLQRPLILVLLALAIWWVWRQYRARRAASGRCPRCGTGAMEPLLAAGALVARCRRCGHEERFHRPRG